MQHPEGQVLSVDTNAAPVRAVVEVATSFRCARCAAGKGCGAGLLAGNPAPHRIDALVDRRLELHVGDRVRLELASGNVLRAAALAYGWPLCGALAGAASAWWSGFGDTGAVLAALAGTLAGVVLGRWRLRQGSCLQQFRPLVTARLDPG